MKHTAKKLLLLSTLVNVGYADIAATTQDVRAFVLPKDTMSIKGSYNRVNDSIDFLNLHEEPNPSTPYSALGDSAGIDFSLAYGAHRHVSLYYNFEALNLHYAGSKLENRKQELYTRVNFYESPHYIFDAFSMDLGYIHNSADDFNAELTDLSDNAYYLRLLLGNQFGTSLLNFYTGFKYASINTDLNGRDLSRNEKSLMLGLSHTIEFSHYILDTKYEYTRLFDRHDITGDDNSNHVFDIHLARAFSDNLLLYVGLKIMLNQFNGVIPYLYNEQTQSSFDKKYNYINAGFVYNFDFLSKTQRQHYRKKKAQGPKTFSFFGL